MLCQAPLSTCFGPNNIFAFRQLGPRVCHRRPMQHNPLHRCSTRWCSTHTSVCCPLSTADFAACPTCTLSTDGEHRDRNPCGATCEERPRQPGGVQQAPTFTCTGTSWITHLVILLRLSGATSWALARHPVLYPRMGDLFPDAPFPGIN